jgi:hypothetical protein
MDRLQEANKVASVMRRRESPRPLQAAQLINAGVQEARGFTDVKLSLRKPSAIVPRVAPARSPRMAPVGDMVAVPNTAPAAGSPILCAGPSPSRSSAPVIAPLRIVKDELSPRCAPPVRGIDYRAAVAQVRRRLLATTWRTTTQPVLGGLLPRVRPSAAYPVASGARSGAFGTAAAAAKGRALRVSLAVRFGIPEWKLRPLMLRGPSAAEIVWPGPQPLGTLPFGPAAATLAAIAPAEILSVPQMRVPAAPSPVFPTVFRWPQTKGISLTFANPAVPHRSATVPFTSSEEFSPKERQYEYRD